MFGLLAKLAPLHYRADEAAWRASIGTRAASVDCAPLLPLRQLDSASACHGCGRCSGHRGAIRLEARSPNAEILERGAQDGERWQSALVIFGMIGLAMGAFEWSASPWLVAARQAIAEWLVERDILWPLDSDAPWWLLTHYPAVNDSFSWLDGALLLGWMGASMLLVGGAVAGLLALASRLLGGGRPGKAIPAFHHLSLGLVPLAGAGVFLGLSATTVTLLKGERLPLQWVSPTRATLLAAATGWSLYLAWRICGRHAATPPRRVAAWCAVLAACLLVDYGWSLWFWLW
ncbi:hypothetical protein [Chitinimonas koreensis]|uniref:hypothetical protein n=1 Tax=Chitinimonas koreensis TaxID=356302 RepID=UPI0027E45E6D|nr:hypothetical protein [Chitinimonas koreensis]